MSINFDNKDDRMGYLNEKMDDLLDGIDEQYGKALFDELLVRLKNTVVDFNEEVQGMTNQLKSSTDKRSQLIEKIKLSIDSDLQIYIEKLLFNKVGSVVAIEPSTGNVLAMVSSPNFDLNFLSGRDYSTNRNFLATRAIN